MKPEDSVIEKIRHQGLPVIIFGAGVVGEVVFHSCRSAGIPVECFCDNNVNKTKGLLCNTKVLYPPDMKRQYPEAAILISAADLGDVVTQLHGLGYDTWHAVGPLLRDFDFYPYEFSAPSDFVEYAVATCLLCQDSYLSPDKLFLRSVDVIITERCSLKCRDCSNLVQYYKRPSDCDTKGVLLSIDVFCSVVDEVNEFRVIGGEPFMHKEHHLIVKRLAEEPKVKKVVIYTNGTIVPREDQIEHLKNSKVLIIITDYGHLSRRIDELKKTLYRAGIAHYAHEARGWTDCAAITPHHRTVEQQRQTFKGCCAKNTISLSDGKLYRCPFSANADRLRAVPVFKEDSVTLLRNSQLAMDIVAMRNALRKFLLRTEYLQSCDYCNGRPFEAPEITPAVQTKRPLEYEICCSQ